MRLLRRQPLATLGIVLLIVVVVMAVFAPVLAPYAPQRNGVGPELAGPSAAHLFGTDDYGRDTLSRIMYGGRVSLLVGFGAMAVNIFLATIVGVVSANLGGIADQVLQRFVDAVQALPALILLVACIVIVGPSARNVTIIIGLWGGFAYSRVVRAAALLLASAAFVDAAQSIGAGRVRVIVAHMLPNLVPSLLVLASVSIGTNILTEASLGFLGYGVPPPQPTLGGMLSADNRLYMVVSPALFIFPALILALIVFAVNMLGDGLRDELDPRLRGR